VERAGRRRENARRAPVRGGALRAPRDEAAALARASATVLSPAAPWRRASHSLVRDKVNRFLPDHEQTGKKQTASVQFAVVDFEVVSEGLGAFRLEVIIIKSRIRE
jgi:hypothetical protein